MQRDLASSLACYSSAAGSVVGLASYFSPQEAQQLASSSSAVVDGLLGSVGAGGGHGHGHGPQCNGGSSWRAAAVDVAGGCEEARRKARRLASNRESARRSRVRRRRQLDELSACTAELRADNQRLVVALNRAEARHARVVRENQRLREEARRLRERLGEGGDDDDEVGDGDDDAATARAP